MPICLSIHCTTCVGRLCIYGQRSLAATTTPTPAECIFVLMSVASAAIYHYGTVEKEREGDRHRLGWCCCCSLAWRRSSGGFCLWGELLAPDDEAKAEEEGVRRGGRCCCTKEALEYVRDMAGEKRRREKRFRIFSQSYSVHLEIALGLVKEMHFSLSLSSEDKTTVKILE